jgi:Zn-dependent M28 family amino/carboxypeptidase
MIKLISRFGALALVFSLPGLAFAQSAAVNPANLMRHVEVLASDSFEGRAPGTPGEVRTVGYLVDQLKSYGLEPGGPNGTWIQPVTLARFQLTSTPVSRFAAGRRVMALEHGTQVVLNTRRSGQARVNIANAPLVWVGYGVTAADRGYSDYAGVDMRGKIAVMLVNDADFETGDNRGFGGRAMSYAGRWTYKYEEAFRQGAVGALIVHDPAGAGYGWPTVLASWTFPQFDLVPPRGAPPSRSPLEGWMTQAAAVELFNMAGRNFADDRLAARERGFKPVALGVTFSTRFNVSETRINSYNVLAKRTGSGAPDETVLMGAHHDHLGIGRPQADGDNIYNGAADNATGTAGLLEVARLTAAAPAPRRTMVFAFWAAEEKGLLGSEFYARNPVYPLATTAAGFNFDGMGQLGRTRDVMVVGSGKSTLEDDLAALISADRTIKPDGNPEVGSFYRSDHFPLAKVGVPVLYLRSGVEVIGRPPGVAEAALQDYITRRYHQPDDEITPDWDLSGGAEDATLVWRIAMRVANGTTWPSWRAGDEFEGVRATTASARR